MTEFNSVDEITEKLTREFEEYLNETIPILEKVVESFVLRLRTFSKFDYASVTMKRGKYSDIYMSKGRTTIAIYRFRMHDLYKHGKPKKLRKAI